MESRKTFQRRRKCRKPENLSAEEKKLPFLLREVRSYGFLKALAFPKGGNQGFFKFNGEENKQVIKNGKN